mgnify:CR=1 FL=1
MSCGMVLKSTVTRIGGKGRERYLKTIIPIEIIEELGLRPGDVLAWDVEERGGRKVAVLRKLE